MSRITSRSAGFGLGGRVRLRVRVCTAGVLCTLLVVASAVLGQPTSGPLGGGATLPAGVAFDADVAITDADIAITWRVVNGSSLELLIPTLVSHKGVSPEGEAYVVAAGRNVEIAQRFFDWPDEVEEMATPPSVGVLRVGPGASDTRTIRVSRSLAAYHPFGGGFRGYPTLPSRPEDVVFCLGMTPEPYSPALGLEKDDNGVEFARHGRIAYEQQHRSCTEPVAL